MAPDFQEPEETTEVTRSRHSRTNKILATLLGLFGVVAPVASAYISYKQAKVEFAAEVATAHKESEAGYKAVSSPLGQILPIIVAMAGDIAQLKTEVAMLRGNQTFNVPAPPSSAMTPTLHLHALVGHGGGLANIGGLGGGSLSVMSGVGNSDSGSGSGASAPPAPAAPSQPDDKADESPAALKPLLRPLPKSLHDAAIQMKLE